MQSLCKSLAYLGFSCSTQEDTLLEAQFQQHLAAHALSFGTPEEYAFRFDVFKQTDEEVKKLNSRNLSFTAAHNKFSTYSKQELKKIKGRTEEASNPPEPTVLDTSDLPKFVDWRQQDVINPVVDMTHNCAASYAFSAAAALEAADAISTGVSLYKYSEQQLIDCDRKKNNGCNGGNAANSFKYNTKTGMELENSYPYMNMQEADCDAHERDELTKIKSYEAVVPNSIDQLKASIAIAPTVVSIDSGYAVTSYYGGIIDDDYCGTDLDTQVLAVGYDQDWQTGQEFLILRNQWGFNYGEDGYFRIALKEDGEGYCGVLKEAYRPKDSYKPSQ